MRPTCSIAPSRSRLARSLGLPPKIVTSPEVAWLNPSSKRTAVVLPAPFGPSRATTSPWSKLERETIQRDLPAKFLADARAATQSQNFPLYSRCGQGSIRTLAAIIPPLLTENIISGLDRAAVVSFVKTNR